MVGFCLFHFIRAKTQTFNLDHKIRNHMASSIKRREPGIAKLATMYNSLCSELWTMITKGKAPTSVVPPQPIQRDGLFKLDVDDDIWQDIGLDDDHHGPVARWLGDDGVRDGIRAMLQLDRCYEEKVRLQQERCALQE